MKKIIITVLILISLLSQSVFAFELRAPRTQVKFIEKTADDIFFDNFTTYDEGTDPTSFKVKEYDNHPVEVTEYETPDGKKNVLKLTDTGSGAAILTLDVPECSGPVTFEMRIKAVKTTTDGYGFRMLFQNSAAQNAFTLIRYSDANAWFTYGYSGTNLHLTRNLNHDSEWFVVKVRVDNELRQNGIIIENEQLKSTKVNFGTAAGLYQDFENGRVIGTSLPFITDFEGEVEQIVLTPYGGSAGEFYIDYIKMTKEVPEFKVTKIRAEAELTPEFYQDPKERLLPYELNIIYRGELKYFANKPVTVNGRAMIDADSFADWFGSEVVNNNGMYEIDLDGKKLFFKDSDTSFYIDGNMYTADTPPEYINGFLYIPLRSFATALGDTVLWQDNPKCVEIK